CLQNLHLPLTF
nr:immunoglobulin light chain junction region [Macaca mulatta]MOW44376.1 immunoglobulin light chain junction region [Macaca mulatta]